MEYGEHLGIWWIPDNPDEKVAGILHFELGKKLRLELYSRLKHENPPLILGTTSSGEIVSLLYNRQIHISYKGNVNLFSPTLTTNYALTNAHYLSIEEIKFNRFEIGFWSFEGWCRLHDVEEQLRRQNVSQGVNYGSFTIGEYNFYISRSSTTRNSYDDRSTSWNNRLAISCEYDKPFNEWANLIENFRLFLSFGIGVLSFPTEVKASSWLNHDPFRFIEIYTLTPAIAQAEPMFNFQMLVTYADISQSLESCYQNWFMKTQKLSPVYRLLTESFTHPSTTINCFLLLIRGIEAYHRRVFDNFYISEAEYNSIFETLIKSIPDGVDQKVKHRITKNIDPNSVNQLTLRDRFKELWKSYQSSIKVYTPNRKHFEEFVDDVLDVRNYLTHFYEDETIEGKVRNSYFIYRLNHWLRLILETCILHEIGIPSTSIQQILDRILERRQLRKNKEKDTLFTEPWK